MADLESSVFKQTPVQNVFNFVVIDQRKYSDEIEENEMGRTCDMHDTRQKCSQGCGWKT